MADQTTETTSRTGHSFTLAAGVAVVVCLVAASTLLAYKGWQTTEIAAFLAAVSAVAVPLVGAVGKLTELNVKQDAQTVKITKIDHQTNGVLDKKIRDNVRDAVQEAFNAPFNVEPTEKDDQA